MIEAIEASPRRVHASSQSSVSRAPSRIVPPILVLSTSGMKTTAWCLAGGSPGVNASSNSADVAAGRPSTDRQYSMTASCMPRQTPRYGLRRSRQNLAAAIMPRMPRLPKPPGTTTPSASASAAHAAARFDEAVRALSSASSSASSDGSSKSVDSIQAISRRRSASMAACLSALRTLRYESWSPVYLPTMAIVTTASCASMARAMRAQEATSHSSERSSFKVSRSRAGTAWSSNKRGTW
mmetsp:Transcript_23469/g.93021  ORF Transcript_23469/g.93021 Transcript_23469/m.93021 type:complete len:239 (+) Transcript_23469:718-1434(+)